MSEFDLTGTRKARRRSAVFETFPQLPNEPWMQEGLCAQTDPDSFFPDKGGSAREAKRVCLNCPVREECLQYALEHNERWGVWGGETERARRRMQIEKRNVA
jgi:WhiB family redox-sensing transcriptional regulator